MRALIRGLLLVAAVFGLTACLPDLSGFEVLRERPTSDGGGPPPTRDAGPTGPRSGGPCARPTLFAAAHELGGDAGRVLRWEVQGTGGLIPCGDVLAEGRMDQLPFAVAAVDESYIVVASRSGVMGIDPIADRVLWTTTTSNLHPNDAFVVDDPVRGGRVPVVAWSSLGSCASPRCTIRLIEAYGGGGELLQMWSGGDLMLGSATAMSGNVQNPGEPLAMNNSVYSAGEVDLFGAGRRDPALVGPFGSTSIRTVSSGRSSDGNRRVVWSATIFDTMAGTSETGVLISNDAWSGGEVMLDGVGSCGEVPCDPVHAVLDTTIEQGVFTICDGSPPELIRFDLGRSLCETWANAESLGTRRLAYLAVLP